MYSPSRRSSCVPRGVERTLPPLLLDRELFSAAGIKIHFTRVAAVGARRIYIYYIYVVKDTTPFEGANR